MAYAMHMYFYKSYLHKLCVISWFSTPCRDDSGILSTTGSSFLQGDSLFYDNIRGVP